MLYVTEVCEAWPEAGMRGRRVVELDEAIALTSATNPKHSEALREVRERNLHLPRVPACTGDPALVGGGGGGGGGGPGALWRAPSAALILGGAVAGLLAAKCVGLVRR